MEYDELVKAAVKFRDARDWQQFHTPENLAKSISIEANELLECFQWNGTQFDAANVQEELADVFLYCIYMADTLGVDLVDVAAAKMQQNARKYPVEKAKGNATKYNRL